MRTNSDINRDMEILKRDQKEMLRLKKNTIMEMNHAFNKIISRLHSQRKNQ